jgi:hypothetical protein
MLDRLNQLAAPAREADRFVLRDGRLTGYVDTRWREPELIALLHAVILDHLGGGVGRLTFGIEIGTGSAKLYGARWPSASSGVPVVDVKLELPQLLAMSDPISRYGEMIDTLVEPFRADVGWLVPPENIDLDEPGCVLDGCADRAADLVYVYGTHGPREARDIDPRMVPPYLRILSGEEEARLVFDAIVPPEHAAPGTMAIEIGSGSTELILIDNAGRKRTIAFAVGGAHQGSLEGIASALAAADARNLQPYLECDLSTATDFIAAEKSAPRAALFMNPNRDSEALRRSMAVPLTVAAARDYADTSTDKFAPKAKVLAALARALGFTVIHEGRKGGLKAAMAAFIARAAGA